MFGIAPQGNIQNDENMGADVKTWCSTPGYIDYICPQLYVNFENSYLPFDEGANQWKELVTNEEIKLYFGLGCIRQVRMWMTVPGKMRTIFLPSR